MQLLHEMFDFITNFQVYLEDLLETVKDLTGVDIDFSVVGDIMEGSESFAEFITDLLEYILQEVS